MLLGSLNRDEGRDVETGVASPAAVGKVPGEEEDWVGKDE